MKNISRSINTTILTILSLTILSLTGSGQMPAMPGTQTAEGQASAVAPETGPKQENVLRIGIVMPKTAMSQQDGSEQLRSTVISYLNGPTLELVPITARLPVQVAAEAIQRRCDFLLFTALTQKQGGGSSFGKLFGKMAPMLGSVMPMGGMIGGVIAATAVSTVASMAGNIKAKDEVTLEYVLTAIGETNPRLSKTLKGKAKNDGDDVLTPMIEQMANSILETTAKK